MTPDYEPALYTDQQVITATSTPVDSLRRLITWGAVQPAQSGGGRGRVRLWTVYQALRICITSELVAAGYSLRMAHTLTYCLPIGNLMMWYDPPTLTRLIRGTSTDTSDQDLLKVLTQKRPSKTLLGGGQYARSQVLIVDRRFVYSGSYQSIFELVAEIDSERQRVIPFHDPVREADGDRETEDGPTIDKASLLIDRRYLSGKGKLLFESQDATIRVQKLETILAKSLLALDLSLSFILCVRKLQGLKTSYSPTYIEDEDEAEK